MNGSSSDKQDRRRLDLVGLEAGEVQAVLRHHPLVAIHRKRRDVLAHGIARERLQRSE